MRLSYKPEQKATNLYLALSTCIIYIIYKPVRKGNNLFVRAINLESETTTIAIILYDEAMSLYNKL